MPEEVPRGERVHRDGILVLLGSYRVEERCERGKYMGLEPVGEFAGLVGHGCTVGERGGYVGSPVAYLGEKTMAPLAEEYIVLAIGKNRKTWFGHPLFESISG